MHRNHHKLEILDDGEARVVGMDYGPHPKVTMVREGIVVVKVPGHSTWMGIGVRGYMPTMLYVFRLVDKLSDTEYIVEEIADMTTKGEYGEPR